MTSTKTVTIELTDEEIKILSDQHSRDMTMFLMKRYLAEYYQSNLPNAKQKDHLRYIAKASFPSFVSVDKILEKIKDSVNAKTP